MSNREKGLWALYASAIVLLFLMSSTNLIIKEEKTEIFPVSVVIEDTTDSYYENFRKGMDQAAREMNVDMNFITLYEANDQEQQIELVMREINDGAKAVILSPADGKSAARQLENAAIGVPLVVYGCEIPMNAVTSVISFDHMEAGRILGQAVRKDVRIETPVYVFSKGLRYGAAEEVYQGITAELEGYTVSLKEGKEDEMPGILASVLENEKEKPVIFALEPSILEKITGEVKENPDLQNRIEGIYGMGTTTRLLNDMDQGIVTGMAVVNSFDAGYMCVQKAVESAAGSWKKEQVMLDIFYIDKENMREKQYEKMLYPIN